MSGNQIPPKLVWRVLRKRLLMKSYKLQLVQIIRQKTSGGAASISVLICKENLKKSSLFFSDVAIFHRDNKVNKHNARILGNKKPYATIDNERDSIKVNMFCAISKIIFVDSLLLGKCDRRYLSANTLELVNG